MKNANVVGGLDVKRVALVVDSDLDGIEAVYTRFTEKVDVNVAAPIIGNADTDSDDLYLTPYLFG